MNPPPHLAMGQINGECLSGNFVVILIQYLFRKKKPKKNKTTTILQSLTFWNTVASKGLISNLKSKTNQLFILQAMCKCHLVAKIELIYTGGIH